MLVYQFLCKKTSGREKIRNTSEFFCRKNGEKKGELSAAGRGFMYRWNTKQGGFQAKLGKAPCFSLPQAATEWSFFLPVLQSPSGSYWEKGPDGPSFPRLVTVLQADCSIENQVAGTGIPTVRAEVALAHKLKTGLQAGPPPERPLPCSPDESPRNGDSGRPENPFPMRPVRIIKQVVIQPDLRILTIPGVHPVNGALYLPSVSRISAPGIRIIGAQNLCNPPDSSRTQPVHFTT